ncbi:DUF3800 domain-containing protein [Kineococcus glutinatus]
MLFVDESGTNSKDATFTLGAVAVHESAMQALNRRMNDLMAEYSRLTDHNTDDLEIHASEMLNPGKGSPWKTVNHQVRRRVLDRCYESLRLMEEEGSAGAVAFFGVAMDSRFKKDYSVHAREQIAYEHLLKKFDDYLVRRTSSEMGWVVHDRRIVAERDVRQWARGWQEAAGALGRINRFADLPLFADSKTTRLLQVADLVAYAFWRSYDKGHDQYIEKLWSQFDIEGGRLHGAIHLTPDYADHKCSCIPCSRRLSGNVKSIR